MENIILPLSIFVATTVVAIIGFFLRSAYGTINKQIEILI